MVPLPEYNPTQISDQNNNETPFLRFHSKIYSQWLNVFDENPYYVSTLIERKINVDSGKTIAEKDNVTNFCHDNDEFSEEPKKLLGKRILKKPVPSSQSFINRFAIFLAEYSKNISDHEISILKSYRQRIQI